MVPILAAAFGGATSALLYLSVLFGGLGALILGYLAPLPLFATGLWLGASAAALAALAGTLLVALASGGALAAIAYMVSAALPVVVLARQALLARTAADGSLEWYPPGLALMVLTGLGFGLFLLAALLTAGEPDGLEGVAREALVQMARQFAPDQPPLEADALWIASALPGMVIISWMVMTIVNGALAQGLVMRFGVNRRPSMGLADLDLPGWMVPAFLGGALVSALVPGFLGFLALNASMILAVPLGFLGLSVVHAYARGRSARVPLLVGFYLFLFLFGWPIVFLIGLGVIEQWIGLRRRIAAAGPGEEDE